jgi:hypothetical protein
MTLHLAFYAYYYTAPGGITGKLYDAQDFVRAIKDRKMKGKFAKLPHPTGPFVLQIRPDDTTAAKLIFSDFGVHMLRDVKDHGWTLVGVPPSKSTIEHKEPHLTDRLAMGIVQRANGNLRAASLLRWDQPMPSASSEGGSREPELLYPHLRLVQPVLVGQNYVIIDDVCTGGGHLRACAAKIRHAGGTVQWAICSARTTHEAVAEPFGTFIAEYDDYVP